MTRDPALTPTTACPLSDVHGHPTLSQERDLASLVFCLDPSPGPTLIPATGGCFSVPK